MQSSEKPILPIEKMNRINELAKKSKAEGLSEAEKAEQTVLREEYLAKFREGFRQQLENIEVTYVDDIKN